jgi:hypothetical protein
MARSDETAVERLLKAVADRIARHCRLLAAVAILSVALPAWWLQDLETYNDIESWLLRDTPEYTEYEAFLDTFGSEEYVIAVARMEDPFSAEAIERQDRLAEKLEALDGVDGVLSIPRFARSVWPERTDWRAEAAETSFLRDLLLGRDEKTVGVLAWFRPIETKFDRRRTVEAIEAIAAEESGPGFELRLAGTPLVNVALNRTCVRDLTLLVPLALAVAVAVLVIIFRTVAQVLAPLLTILITVTWTAGLMAATGATLNMVTVTLPPLLTVLVLSNGIHLSSRFADHLAAYGDKREAARRTLRELVRPALLASVTTAAGCASLMVAEMQPVKEMGTFAAIGILIGLVMNLTIVPGVLATIPWKARSPSRRWQHWSSRTGRAVTRHWRVVVPVSVAAVAACAFGISQITVEPHVLRFLPKHSEVKRDYTYINKNLTGFYTVEIEARTDIDHEDAVLDAMDRLAESLGERPDVARTIHIGQIQPYIDRAVLIGTTGGEAGRFMNDIRDRFRKRDDKRDNQLVFRQSVIIREHKAIKVRELVDACTEQSAEEMPAEADVTITGIVRLIKQAELGLVRTQIKSFSLAAGVSLLLIGLLYRSVRAFGAAIVPNLLPVVGTFALMASLGIPLDVATVMIASVSIAIAVDDTVHFLERYQEGRRQGADAADSAAAAFAKAGRAMVFTSVVAAAGFAILSFSSFVPMANLGVLSGIAMMTALAGDLFVLPATARLFNLWATRGPQEPGSSGKRRAGYEEADPVPPKP